MKRRVGGTKCHREPRKLKRGAGMTLNMALELRTDCFCIGCDGLRPLPREGMFCTC